MTFWIPSKILSFRQVRFLTDSANPRWDWVDHLTYLRTWRTIGPLLKPTMHLPHRTEDLPLPPHPNNVPGIGFLVLSPGIGHAHQFTLLPAFRLNETLISMTSTPHLQVPSIVHNIQRNAGWEEHATAAFVNHEIVGYHCRVVPCTCFR